MLVFAFLFAPIVVLVVFSFNKARSGTALDRLLDPLVQRRSLTTSERSRRSATRSRSRSSRRSSRRSSARSAAFALTRFKFRGRSGYSTLIFISLVMPEIVMAISLTAFFRRFAHIAAEHLRP